MYKKKFKEKNLVPWDLSGVPRVHISGPNRGIFSKLIGPGPLGSKGHSHTSFSNGRFQALETSFHIDVLCNMEDVPPKIAVDLNPIFKDQFSSIS